MRKTALILAALLFAFVLCACENEDTAAEIQPTAALEETVKNDLFAMALFTDKKTYRANESFVCHATLEYVGDGDFIDAAYTGECVTFSISSPNGFLLQYAPDAAEEKSTAFEKGKTEEYRFYKTKCFIPDDNAAVARFISADGYALPAGEYQIRAAFRVSIYDENEGAHELVLEVGKTIVFE